MNRLKWSAAQVRLFDRWKQVLCSKATTLAFIQTTRAGPVREALERSVRANLQWVADHILSA